MYPYRPNARRINAYEDADYWVGVNVKRIQDLWLDRSPSLQILDLGCGPGYFLYLCRLFGHEALGLDPDEEPFFRGTTEHFGVRRVVARIHPHIPLPDLRKKFDLVTGHRVCFHRIRRAENGEWLEWSSADWEFFINDVRTRFLKRRHFRFSISAAARAIFSTCAGFSVTKRSGLILMMSHFFAAQPSILAFAALWHGSIRIHRYPVWERSLIS